ncbi:Uma2 family endonuclease [Nostocoides veronense]|uniref:Uma2 family endonuclease n=1 Tax=Nostocoides veronense TaxID=330836 RepID=A0ABN2LX69_9MICO
MSAVTIMSAGRAFTRADLDRLPDDGRRHELLDGSLIVTPAPSPRHQRVQMRLIALLLPAVPAGLDLLAAPVDVALDGATILQPDLLLAERARFTDKDLPCAPLLAIEILSSSTRRFDLLTKRAAYETAGCEHYWVIDPEAPSMTAWRLVDGEYADPVRALGDEEFTVTAPLVVGFRPADLLA